MMKELLFSGTSRPGRLIFKQMLNLMESPARNHLNNPQKLVEASGIQAGQTVLEVGCGSGFFTPALADSVGEAGQVESIDLHPMSVEMTTRKLNSLGKRNVRVSQADAHQTNFPENSFDTILVYGIIPAPFISESRLAREMYRILKSGGTLAVWTAVPFWTPKSLLDAAPFMLYDKRQGVSILRKS